MQRCSLLITALTSAAFPAGFRRSKEQYFLRQHRVDPQQHVVVNKRVRSDTERVVPGRNRRKRGVDVDNGFAQEQNGPEPTFVARRHEHDISTLVNLEN